MKYVPAIACGLSVCLLIIASICSGSYVSDDWWYDYQSEGTCKDDVDASGDAVAKMTIKALKNGKTEYFCSIRVAGTEVETGFVHDYLERDVGTAYSTTADTTQGFALDYAAAKAACNLKFAKAKDSEYFCFIPSDGSPEIFYEVDTQDLDALFAAQLVLWPLSLVCCLLSVIAYVCQSSLSSSTIFSGKHPATVETDALKRTPTSDGAGMAESVNSFRRVRDTDLCEEMIPGLRLRVLWPPGKLGRWYAATSTSFDKADGKADISFSIDRKLNVLLPAKASLSIKEGCVRLHEDSMAQVAKRRILTGAVKHCMFSGTTFENLDTDGNGKIDASELKAGLDKLGIKLDSKTAQALLQILDTDGSGSVDAQEFKKFMMKDGGLV